MLVSVTVAKPRKEIHVSGRRINGLQRSMREGACNGAQDEEPATETRVGGGRIPATETREGV
jgi:hypothetical protein